MADPASNSIPAATASDQSLCLVCGLCCNGVLFADVELQESDDPTTLNQLGLSLKVASARQAAGVAKVSIRFSQPCPALYGCHCSIYHDRPARCRQFDCALLLAVRKGKTSPNAALLRIQETRNLVARIRQLMKTLGDRSESTAMSLRFQRLRCRMETEGRIDETIADAYADLTLAVHELQQRLKRHFYL